MKPLAGWVLGWLSPSPPRLPVVLVLCLGWTHLIGPVALCSPASEVEDLYRRGTELVRSGHFHEALEGFQKAAKLSPNNPKIHNMVGVVLTQLDRLEEADEAYNKALRIAPGFFPARKNRAVNAFTRGNFKFAAEEFAALARLNPRDFVPRLFLGLLAIEDQDFEGARKSLLEARQLSPGNSRILLALTRVHLALGERQPALDLAHELCTKSPATDAEQFELGIVLGQFRADVEAADVLQRLWLKNTKSCEVGFNLALLQYRVGQLGDAVRIVEGLLSDNRALLRNRAAPEVSVPCIQQAKLGSGDCASKGELLNLQGWIYAKMLRLDKARQALEEAIAAEPHNADHYLDLSTMLNSEGDSDTAVRILSEGLQRDVDQARLQVQIGLLHQKGRNYQEAEKWFEQAANPTNRSAYLGLANLMLETDRRNEALNLLDKAVQLLPEDALLHHMYGGLLVESAREADPKQLEKATSVLNKALRLNPFYANTHYLLGRLQLKNGDYDAAKSLFEKASGLDPNHAGAYYQLSLIARRQGKIAMAQELARTVQKLNERSRKNDQENFSRLVRESLSTPSVGIPRAGD